MRLLYDEMDNKILFPLSLLLSIFSPAFHIFTWYVELSDIIFITYVCRCRGYHCFKDLTIEALILGPYGTLMVGAAVTAFYINEATKLILKIS